MRIVITGATGNVGTSLLERLAKHPNNHDILGLARRTPERELFGARFAAVDVTKDDLAPHFAQADAVVHLAWRVQPAHDEAALRATNVDGSRRVFEEAARAKVRVLVHASSVGVYGPSDKGSMVDESFSTAGIETSSYSMHKVAAERALDDIERAHPAMRVVRLRPALIFKREAASDIRRLFIGPFVPRFLFGPGALRIVPSHPKLALQCVHGRDVGDAFRLALQREVRGAFNIASDPVLDSERLAAVLGAAPVKVSRTTVRALITLAHRARLVAAEPGWCDLAFDSPLIDSSRARSELGWSPSVRADEALLELLAGLREGAGMMTAPLAPRRGLGLFRTADPG